MPRREVKGFCVNGRRWGLRVAGTVAAVLFVAVRSIRGDGGNRSDESVADREFDSVSGLCGRVDPSPADVLFEPLRLLNTVRGDPKSSIEQESCTFEAASGTSRTTLTVHASLADTLAAARQVFRGVQRGTPAQGLAEHWDEGSIDSTNLSPGADIAIWALDGALIMYVRFAWSGSGASEERQTAAVLKIADDVRTLLHG